MKYPGEGYHIWTILYVYCDTDIRFLSRNILIGKVVKTCHGYHKELLGFLIV